MKFKKYNPEIKKDFRATSPQVKNLYSKAYCKLLSKYFSPNILFTKKVRKAGTRRFVFCAQKIRHFLSCFFLSAERKKALEICIFERKLNHPTAARKG